MGSLIDLIESLGYLIKKYDRRALKTNKTDIGHPGQQPTVREWCLFKDNHHAIRSNTIKQHSASTEAN